jgi:hypothetical protein
VIADADMGIRFLRGALKSIATEHEEQRVGHWLTRFVFRTLRGRTEGVGHPEAWAGEPVDVGRSDPGVAVDAEVAPAEIVGDEYDDVGRTF